MNQKTAFKLLVEIFLTFLKIGCFTFGGGYAMIPLIEREVIDKKHWVKEEEVIDVFAVSESIPGAIAINSSTFIGYKIAGKKGAVAAMFGVIIPSFVIITLIASVFVKFQDSPIVKAAFLGIRSAVVALILMAAIKIGKAAIKDTTTILITAGAIIMVLVLEIHAIYAIIGGAIIGLIIYALFAEKARQIIERNSDKK